MSPTRPTARPTWNGRNETSALRVTIGDPSGTTTSGARKAAQPTPAMTPSATGPPASPNQSTHARKTPATTRPRPTSSASWWLRALLRRRSRAREPTERFLGAMQSASRLAAALLLGYLESALFSGSHLGRVVVKKNVLLALGAVAL